MAPVQSPMTPPLVAQEPSQGVTPAPQSQNTTSYRPLIIILGVVAILILAILGIVLFMKKSYTAPMYTQSTSMSIAKKAAAITGQVLFEGYAPANSYIAIAERSEGNGSYKDVVSGLLPGSTPIPWTWQDATSGKNYELIAELKVQGKTIQSSPVQDVSAPATNVVHTLVSTQKPPAPAVATMSGQINVDGYIPTGAILNVLAMPLGGNSFQTVASGIAAVDNANWTWTGATSGTTYLVQAQLVSNGNIISTGDTQTTTAPSTGETLNVTSTAAAPAPTPTGLSGTITINGNIPGSSYITLGVRPTGTNTFNQVASNISATNGVSFAWNSAASGSQYDIQAYLWANGQPYAQSNILTVTAPSTFDLLTINAQQQNQAPSGNSLSVSCGAQQNNLYQATINFNTQGNINNATTYNIISTLASQNSQVMNTTVSPSNPGSSQSLTTTFIFQPGATYYVQYAYATSTNGPFSPMSPSIQFACQ